MEIQDNTIIVHLVTTLSELTGANNNLDLQKFLLKSNIKIPTANKDKEEEDYSRTEDNKVKGNEEDKDTLFTVKQFANYFQVSENSAREWIKKGYVKYIRIGKRIRIRKAEILALEKRKTPP